MGPTGRMLSAAALGRNKRASNDMAPDLARQRPSKSPSFTPATNSCHSPRLIVRRASSRSTELRIKILFPKIPISTHWPLSHRLALRHVGSFADSSSTATPRVARKREHLRQNTDFPPVSTLGDACSAWVANDYCEKCR